MTRATLPASTPAAAGVDARGISAFVAALEASPDIDPHSLLVLRHGQVLAQGWWAPYTADGAQLLYSLSKTFTGTALGLAVGEGLLTLDDLVLDHLPELADVALDPRAHALRVRHVATMSAGHLDEALAAAVAADGHDWVRGFLGLHPDRDPGTWFAYSQPTTMTVAVILQRLTGMSLTEYLRPRLLDPLGIGEVAWQQDPLGRELGFSGLHTTTDAVARLGQLYLQDGVWDGRRLLPEGWVADASRAHVSTAQRDEPDWRQGYGIQLWRSRHGYRGDGAYGQFCLVLPELDAVVALTSQTQDMQQVLDLVWQHLLPALAADVADLPATRQADAALAGRLHGLGRPAAAGSPAPQDPDPWDGATFSAAPSTPRPGPAGPAAGTPAAGPVQRVQLERAARGWQVTFRLWDEDLVVDLAPGWTRSAAELADGLGPLPVAVSGGWPDGSTLELQVVLTETPHSLRLRCDLTDGSLRSSWRTEPLTVGSVAALRAPWPVR